MLCRYICEWLIFLLQWPDEDFYLSALTLLLSILYLTLSFLTAFNSSMRSAEVIVTVTLKYVITSTQCTAVIKTYHLILFKPCVLCVVLCYVTFIKVLAVYFGLGSGQYCGTRVDHPEREGPSDRGVSAPSPEQKSKGHRGGECFIMNCLSVLIIITVFYWYGCQYIYLCPSTPSFLTFSLIFIILFTINYPYQLLPCHHIELLMNSQSISHLLLHPTTVSILLLLLLYNSWPHSNSDSFLYPRLWGSFIHRLHDHELSVSEAAENHHTCSLPSFSGSGWWYRWDEKTLMMGE